MTEEISVLVALLIILGSMLGFFAYCNIADYYSSRFSPMGPWPSKHEEHKQRVRDSKASYKEEYKGVVPVKTYRWSGEKELNIQMGWPTIHVGYKTVRYRKEFDSDEWVPWEEKIDGKNYKGHWRSIDVGWSCDVEGDLDK